MNHLRNSLALAVYLGVASGAHAGVSATALFEVDNFQVKGSDGQVLDADTDFVVNSLVWTGGADEDVSLDTATDSRSLPNSTTGVDFPAICVGDCPQIGENTFPVISGAPSTNYATADQIETGSPIINLGSFTFPARVGNGAYVGIATGAQEGSTNSNNNLEANWTFQLAHPGGITFEGDVRVYTECFVGSGEIAPGKAEAAHSFSLTITDLNTGQVVFQTSPSTLNQSVACNASDLGFDLHLSGTHTLGAATPVSLSITTPPLNNTSIYQLSIRNNVNADAARIDQPVEVLGCRLTGGGVSSTTLDSGEVIYVWDGSMWQADSPEEANRYQLGGQTGANTALPPQPKGEWQHHQQSGPFGSFSFHTGTASAPVGSEIIEIRCSDPGGCTPSGNPPSPNKQLDFDCIGTFKNIGHGKNAPHWLIPNANVTDEGNGNKTFDGTYHYCEVNVDDLGEGPDPAEPNSPACPPEGFGEKGDPTEPANCDCPDFYRITIYDGVNASDVVWLDENNIDPASLNTTDVIYEVDGYLGRGGNGLQLHDLTGFDKK